jgi:hypothetical protein
MVISDIRRSMRKLILLLSVLLVSTSSFGQTANTEMMGGKTGEVKTAPARKKAAPKAPANQTRPASSPCGAYSTSSVDKWFSLGQSANKQFWYNPHRTTCEAKTGVLKSWMKEVHKNTDGDFALVLYEFKCKTNQLRVKTVIEYDSAGSVLDTTNHDDDEPWQDVAPGTAGEVMMRTVCRRP